MSRPLRIEYEGAWYHVMNRGRGRAATFTEPRAYELFLETVAEACERFRLEVHGYCLMPNHYHMLVRTPLGNLSRAMRHIDGVYTQRHNRLTGADGTLFRGRYKAIVIDADAYLLSVSRYIHRNPIDGSRPVVDRLEAWPWSSYPAYLGSATAPLWLERDAIYDALGQRNRQSGYRRFVEAGVEEEIAQYYSRRRQAPVLGDEDFRERVMAGQEAREVPAHEQRPWRAADDVIEAVAAHYKIPVEQLTQRGVQGRRKGEAPALAMWLCQEETGLTLQEIGELFGGIHYSAVAQGIRRLKRDFAGPDLEKLRRTVLQR